VTIIHNGENWDKPPRPMTPVNHHSIDPEPEDLTDLAPKIMPLMIPKGQSGTKEHDRRSSAEGATGRALS
jgi:hypothetical protein